MKSFTTVTILYYDENSLALEHMTASLPCGNGGRVIIPDELKHEKSIVAVLEGKVNILNRSGDRVFSQHQLAEASLLTNSYSC